jgi:folate-binding protein YgfZ
MDEVFSVLLKRDVLKVEGSEAATFLQGQVSQEVETLKPGQSAFSFLLEPRGQVEGFFRVSRADTDLFYLDTEPMFGAALRASLERFKLRTKAEFTDLEWDMLAIRGIAEIPEPFVADLVAPAFWPGMAGFDLLGSKVSSPIRQETPGFYEKARLISGLPVMGKEILSGGIPNESGVLDMAVSFHKGCYRGQELVERISARKGGRQQVQRFKSTEELHAEDELYNENGEVLGKIYSATIDGDSSVGMGVAKAGSVSMCTSDGSLVSGSPILGEIV